MRTVPPDVSSWTAEWPRYVSLTGVPSAERDEREVVEHGPHDGHARYPRGLLVAPQAPVEDGGDEEAADHDERVGVEEVHPQPALRLQLRDDAAVAGVEQDAPHGPEEEDRAAPQDAEDDPEEAERALVGGGPRGRVARDAGGVHPA